MRQPNPAGHEGDALVRGRRLKSQRARRSHHRQMAIPSARAPKRPLPGSARQAHPEHSAPVRHHKTHCDWQRPPPGNKRSARAVGVSLAALIRFGRTASAEKMRRVQALPMSAARPMRDSRMDAFSAASSPAIRAATPASNRKSRMRWRSAGSGYGEASTFRLLDHGRLRAQGHAHHHGGSSSPARSDPETGTCLKPTTLWRGHSDRNCFRAQRSAP